MIKIVLPDAGNFDQPVARLVDVHSRGVDSDWMSKRAAAEIPTFKDIQTKEGHSLIHLIAMGASDHYGENRNGDLFFKSAYKLDLVDPDWKSQQLANGNHVIKSASSFTDKLDKGLLEKFSTFTEHGHVFKHHQNKPHKGDKIYGNIKAAAYNHPMERVELMIEVPHGKDWDSDLEKLSSGEDIPFSMACVADPDFPVRTANGIVPISKVQEGDLVLTHRNRYRRVTQLNRRKYSGDVVTIYVEGLPFGIPLTADHPMFAQLAPAHVKELLGPSAEMSETTLVDTNWIHAEHLREGDCLTQATPVAPEGYDPVVNPLFARLLADINSGGEVDPKVKTLLKDYVGTHGSTLYPGLFDSPDVVKACYLGELFDQSEVSVTNGGLDYIMLEPYFLLELRDLLLTMNIPSTIRICRAAEKSTGEVTLGYLLHIDAQYLSSFVSVCEQVAQAEAEGYLSGGPEPEFISTMLQPVKITRIDTVNQTDITTYNFEVEEDESYTLAGMVSHNCKVPYDICTYCGHKARHRGEYCKHAATGLTGMLKSGHVVAVANESPTFFDISRVHRPADRIVWSLTKAASGELVRGADLALDPIYRTYPDISVLMAGETQKVASRIEAIHKLAAIEKQIPASGRLVDLGNGVPNAQEWQGLDSRLSHLKGKHEKASELFRALGDAGICLPLSKFAQLALPGLDQEMVKEAQTGLGGMYRGLSSLADTVAGNCAYDPAPYSSISMDKEAQDLSLLPGAVQSRAIRRVISDSKLETRETSPYDGLSKSAQDLLGQYASYQLGFLEHSKINPELLVTQNFVQ